MQQKLQSKYIFIPRICTSCSLNNLIKFKYMVQIYYKICKLLQTAIQNGSTIFFYNMTEFQIGVGGITMQGWGGLERCGVCYCALTGAPALLRAPSG
jgi:hypothetical protein